MQSCTEDVLYQLSMTCTKSTLYSCCTKLHILGQILAPVIGENLNSPSPMNAKVVSVAIVLKVPFQEQTSIKGESKVNTLNIWSTSGIRTH